MNRRKMQFWVSLLVGFLSLGIMAQTARAEEFIEFEEETVSFPEPGEDWERIQLGSLEDWNTFAEHCKLDTDSSRLYVEMTEDISAEEGQLQAIPFFDGIFDGKGYAIKGISCQNKTEPLGLFCVLGRQALVRDVHLFGNVQPSEECDRLGALAGENRGTVFQCDFQGVVSGSNYVGGLVGCNQETGRIIGCSVYGAVLGESMTGGIAGSNMGTIARCENHAVVNTESMELGTNTLKERAFILDMDKLNTQTGAVQQDMGGIAGYSSGCLYDCRNFGTIGYLHQSYNVGGIAGRSNGLIKKCTNEAAISGRKDIGGIVGQMEPYVEEQVTASELHVFRQQMENMMALTDRAVEDAHGAGKELQDGLNDLSTSLSAAQEKSDNLIRTAINDIPETEYAINSQDAEALWDSMVEVSNQIEMLNSLSQGQKERVSGNLDAIYTQYTEIYDTLVRMRKTEWKIKDGSVDSADSMLLGAVKECINQGKVQGDLNIGGVAGVMGEESSVDPEDEISLSVDTSTHTTYERKAVLDSCINYGDTSAKRNYVGGIAGRGEVGYIRYCENYGFVTTEGDYAGGIAAMSQIPIEGCYVKARLSGQKYVGGIIGQGINRTVEETGSTVTDCKSLVVIEDAVKFYGAISSTPDGTFKRNQFVGESLQGLGTYSAEGVAYPVSYDDLIQGERVPEEFKKLNVIFMAEGNVLKKAQIQYDSSYSEQDYPFIPQKKGYFATWDKESLQHLTSDTVVSVVYKPYIESISSQALRSSNRPVFYAVGDFTDKDVLLATQKEVEDYSVNSELLNQGGVLKHLFLRDETEEGWVITLPRDGRDEHEIRFLPTTVNQQKPKLFLLHDEEYEELSQEKVGSYFSFMVAGNQAEILVVRTNVRYGRLAIMGVVVVILFFCIVTGVKLGKKWRRKKEERKEKLITKNEVVEDKVEKQNVTTTGNPEKETDSGQQIVGNKNKGIRLVLCGLAIVFAGVLVIGTIYVANNPETLHMKVVEWIARKMEEKIDNQLDITLEVMTEGEKKEWNAYWWRTEENGHEIRCLECNGVNLYQSGDLIYLENGMTFKASGLLPEFDAVLPTLLQTIHLGELNSEKVDGGTIYRAKLMGQNGESLVKQISGELTGDIERIEDVTISMLLANWELQSLQLNGKILTKDGNHLSMQCHIQVIPGENSKTTAVPKEVLSALENRSQVLELTPEVLQLLFAFGRFYVQEKTACDITLSTSGILSLKQYLNWYRVKTEDVWIQCVSKNGSTLYYNEKGACTGKGISLTKEQKQVVNTADLLEIIYPLCLQSGLKDCLEVKKTEQREQFVVVLQEEEIGKLLEFILPEAEGLERTLSKGEIQFVMNNGEIEQVTLEITGKAKLLFTTKPFLFRVEMRQVNFPVDFTVPEEVIKNLR